MQKSKEKNVVKVKKSKEIYRLLKVDKEKNGDSISDNTTTTEKKSIIHR